MTLSRACSIVQKQHPLSEEHSNCLEHPILPLNTNASNNNVNIIDVIIPIYTWLLPRMIVHFSSLPPHPFPFLPRCIRSFTISLPPSVPSSCSKTRAPAARSQPVYQPPQSTLSRAFLSHRLRSFLPNSRQHTPCPRGSGRGGDVGLES